MAIFNEDVVINGDLEVNGEATIEHLIVKDNNFQTESLQEWQNAAGSPLVEITGDGRLRVGSDLIAGTPNALMEANQQITLPTTNPKQGIQSKGVLNGGAAAIAEPLTWSAQEMEIQGTGGLSSTHRTLAARVSQQNTGAASAADVQAGYFEADNEGPSTGTLTGIKAQLVNSGQITNAAGLQIEQPQNTGTITNLYGVKIQDIAQGTNNYALHTGTGKVHLGDVLEMVEQGGAPATPTGGNLVLYPSAGLLRLKDSAGVVKTLVDLDTAQTLTNKTLTSPVIGGGSINNTPIGATTPAAGIFTGLTIQQTTANARLFLNANAGQFKDIVFQSDASSRWTMGSDQAAESGSNAGSDWSFIRYNDSGAVLGIVMTVARASGAITFNGNTTINGNVIATPLVQAQNGAGTAFLRVSANAGQARVLDYLSAGVNRWRLATDGSAESGSNVGSNFILTRWDDSGNPLGNPLVITRSSGQIAFSGNIVAVNITATAQAMILRGAASQTANLTEWQNSGAAVLASVSAAGNGMFARMEINNAAGAVFEMDASAGTNRQINFHTANSPRWVLFTNSAAESGSNAGSNFVLNRYADDGTLLGTSLTVTRSNGQVNLYGNLVLSNQDAALTAMILRGAASQAANLLMLQDSSGANQTYMDANGAVIFNEQGNGIAAFRVESDNQTHAFFIEYSADRIGFFQSSPQARIHLTEPTLGNEIMRIESAATNDDPRESVYQNRIATTNATITTLHTFTVPAATTYAIEAIIIARRTGGTAGTAEDGARYKLSAVYKNVGGTATLIGAVTTTADESQAAWDVTLSPSGANVLLRVAGAANNNITWHMTARIYQVGS